MPKMLRINKQPGCSSSSSSDKPVASGVEDVVLTSQLKSLGSVYTNKSQMFG